VSNRGFTRLEIAIVILIIGILGFIALPHFARAKKDATAALIVGDFTRVAESAMMAYAESEVFPPTDKWGRVPPKLRRYLPPGFSFRHGNVEYRWRRWSLPSGLPTRPQQKVLLGLEVRTKDERLLVSLMGVYQGRVAHVTPTQITMIIL
jgi:hypothetical protein